LRTFGAGFYVYNTCAHFKASGLSWPLPPDITDEQLERAVFPEKTPALPENSKAQLPESDIH